MKKLSMSQFRVLGILLLGAMAFQSCKKNNDNSAPVTTTPKEITLQNSTTLGAYLTDKNNRTLYFFSNDANGSNTCTGGCQAFWPIFNVSNLSADNLGDGLTLSDFTTINSASGPQLAYKGWPLYHYAPGGNAQEAPGQVLGEGVDGVWFVAKTDYAIMIANEQLVGHDGKNYKSDSREGLGNTVYFTDGAGRTLYTYALDSLNKNKFTAPDLSNNAAWPIYETNNASFPSILNKTDFGSIMFAGKKQVTYKGWPLHYFGLDGNTRGSNKGISFPQPGVWHVPTAATDIAPHQ